MRFFLIGYMGAGKTYWGKKWAGEHGLTFVDMDVEVEKRAGLSIADIFEKWGESHFRTLERDTLHSFTGIDNCIIATGGGVPVFFNNMEWMKQHGVVIYLAANPEVLHHRLRNEVAHRPLLKRYSEAELLLFITENLNKRMSFYEKAHTIIDTENVTNSTFENILSSCRENS